MNTSPTASVIVCTRNRPDSLQPALTSILASRDRDFELMVVDQSDGDETQELVDCFTGRSCCIRYIRDDGRGLSHARNLGIAVSRGNFIVFTDDDCVVDPEWLGTMVRTLKCDSGAGAAFGAVVAAPYEHAKGFIAGYVPSKTRRLRGRLGKLWDGGIGASMAFRRDALVAIGPFDELLGAGGYFPSCEDGDVAYRVLKGGYAVWHVPRAVVVHYGLRDWRSGSRLTRQTYVAVAVAYMKHLRLGDSVALLLLMQQAWFGLRNLFASLVRWRRPFGFGRVLALGVGIWRSFELKVSRAPALYARR